MTNGVPLIERVATCICLGNLEKREFKMWKETLFKRRAPAALPSVAWRITIDGFYYVE